MRGLALAALVLGLVPATASAASLSAPPYGAVDLGDRVPYRVEGARCGEVEVQVRLTAGERTLDGPGSRALPTATGGCAGVARVPAFGDLRAIGWEQGDPLGVALVSEAGSVPLRFARMEADQGTPAAGSPRVVPAEDQDTGERDQALAMNPGDAVSLGRVNVRRAEALALRLCLPGADLPTGAAPFATTQRAEPPTFISIRQDGPDGAPLVGPIDVAADPQELSRLTTLGFGGCYRLVVLPITGRLQEDAPELFLRAEQGLPDVLRVNSVDVTGTGAKEPEAPEDPARMETIFDGSSFEGWEHENCVLRDGAAVNARGSDSLDISGCSLTWQRPLRDVVLRFRMRREHIYDNAGIYLGEQEIQLRSVGEYLPGGYFGQFAARWQKLNTFPDWSEIEVIQLGARHVVTVNGRTVTDVVRAGGVPEEYRLNLIAQPQWSYRAGADTGFGNEGFPDVTRPNELGAFWFKDVRLLRCAGPEDPLCLRLADARRGQVPVPEGAPPPAAPAEACGPRTVVLRLPRAGLRGLRARVDGRRVRVRRVGRRSLRVALPGRAEGRYVVRVTGRTREGRLVRVTRRIGACG